MNGPSGPEIYLDWNSTTPPHCSVVEEMCRALTETWGNPSSVHARGRQARAILEASREEAARALGVAARDVLFTSGGTEANNLALHSASGLATSRLEHPSVTRVAEALAERGVPVQWIEVLGTGLLDPEAVDFSMGRLPPGATAAVMAANHETGVIQDIPSIAEIVHRRGGRLHVDAVQALGKLSAQHWAGADSVVVAGHKIRGPKGVGVLAWRDKPAPKGGPRPLLLGGAQERGLRPGTLDAAVLAGLGAALRRLDATAHARLGPLRDRLESWLRDCGVATVNGTVASRLPHVSNVSIEQWRGDELVAALDLQRVRISSGSACSAGTAEPSAVVAAMLGRPRALSAIRVSLGETTTEEDIAQAIAAFARVLRRSGHPSCPHRTRPQAFGAGPSPNGLKEPNES